MEWINVKDRLPGNDDMVIIYDEPKDTLGDVGSGFYIDGGFFTPDSDTDGIIKFNDVTHWMPLPETPKS